MHLLTRETQVRSPSLSGALPALAGGGGGVQVAALHAGSEAPRALVAAEEPRAAAAKRIGRARWAGCRWVQAGPGVTLGPQRAGPRASSPPGARQNLAHCRLAPGPAFASAAWAGRHAWQGW